MSMADNPVYEHEPKKQRAAYLEVVKGQLPQRYYLINKNPFIIGRERNVDLQILDERISRIHAAIRYANGAWFIQDQESQNGILINGEKAVAHRLEHGDIISFAEYQFVFNVYTPLS